MARSKRQQQEEEEEDEEGGEEEEEEDDDRIPITSKDAMQFVKRMKNDPTLREISKASLDLDTPEDEEKMFETLKKNPFLQYDAESDKLRLNASMCAVTTQNVKEKIEEYRIGLSREDLVEYDAHLNVPIREHLRSAGVFALKGWRDSNKHVLMLYPRGTDFLVPLSGTFKVSSNRHFLETSMDLRNEIRRGDALVIEGHTYRVSCESSQLESMDARDLKDYIKSFTGEDEADLDRAGLVRRAHALTQTGKPRNPMAGFGGAYFGNGTDLSALEKLPAPFSSSSLHEAKASSSGAAYRLDFTENRLPIDPPYKGNSSGVDLPNGVVHKHGATNDVRRAYWQVAGKVTGNFKNTKDGSDKLDQMLLESKALNATMLERINHNKKELAENLTKRALEAQNQKGGRKRRA